MSPTKQALLICVVFLCGLQDAVLALHGHCADNRCFVLLSEPKDFPGAQRSCRDSGGGLLTISSEQAVETLTGPLSGRSGSYWLELHSTDRRVEESDLGNCSSVSVSGGGNITVSWKQCGDELDGFLCQYVFQDSCSRLETHGGAKVRYTTHMGFDVNDSEVFPPGTIAVVDNYLVSKHLCASVQWLLAPWNCEVLQGGCEHGCNSTNHNCVCPQGQTLNSNRITCAKDPCADCAEDCAEDCRRSGVPYACATDSGYRLAQDGKRCVDVDECEEEEEDLCTGEGEECFNTQGGYQCMCRDGFAEENGTCVDVAICSECEHMICVKPTGVYECACREGFRMSAEDPTKCERHCGERDCPAECHFNEDVKKPDMVQCECPKGYIKDMRNSTTICTDIDECENSSDCEQTCENTFGGYRCSCHEGFRLQDDYKCVATEEDGSGTTARPVVVPSYIKTGSVLGITLFMALSATLLCLLVRTVVKRCGRFELSSFRHPDIDVFYLQQVNTETYKRLSFDKQFKSDLQRL